MLALLHHLLQFSLTVGKQRMNLPVRLVADSVNLGAELLPRCRGILIQQALDFIVVLVKQDPDLLLLLRGQLEIRCKTSKLLVDRLRRMDILKLLTS
jgi:hypothetical protein